MNYNFFDTFNNTFLTQNIDNNNNLFGPYEGYAKGNLFKNLYSEYKNYQPAKLIPKSEKEEALLNLNQMQFAMHELNLYLDVYPNDQNMLTYFINFRNNYNMLLNEYEKKYGALNINSTTLNNIPFGWSTSNWPWDRRNF